jgi:hypothetical protein
LRNTLIGSALFGASCGVSFVALNYLTGNSLWIQLQQSWSAHFAHTRSFEYGSPTDRPFDGSVLVKNWDTTLPTLLGIFFFWKRVRRDPAVLLPLVWLVLSLVVFTTHKPWWSYYYVHNSLPLCWCAGAGLALLWERIRLQPARAMGVLAGVYALCASLWAGTRVYLQVDGICKSPQLYSCLVLKEIERFKPFTTFLFADEPIYSFHAGIPMPPRLAMISLKRLWAGELDNAGIVAELEVTRPGLILITSPGRALPFQDLLEREYRRVYRDATHQLYAHQSISRKAR